MSNEPVSTPTTRSDDGDWQKTWLGLALNRHPRRLALIYLVGLSLAEVLAVLVAPAVGIVLNFLLLLLLLLHAAFTWEQPAHRFLLSLTLVPLIRIVSFSLPLIGFQLEYWYFFTSVPLFGAAYVVMRQSQISWRQVGVTWRGWPLQLGIGLAGVGLGYLEYLILRPEPLVEVFTWQAVWLPALILLVSTGFLEEYIFRGIMQITAIAWLDRLMGISYVALFFAVLHVGYRSITDFVFVLVVGLIFGFIVQATQNIMGVTLAHGLTNIFLFLVFPFMIGSQQASLPPLAQGGPADVFEALVVESSFLPAGMPGATVSPVTPELEGGVVWRGDRVGAHAKTTQSQAFCASPTSCQEGLIKKQRCYVAALFFCVREPTVAGLV